MNIKHALILLVITIQSCCHKSPSNVHPKHTKLKIAKQLFIDSKRKIIFKTSDTFETDGKVHISYCHPALVTENDTILIDSTCGFELCELSSDKQFVLLSKREYLHYGPSNNDDVYEFSFCLKVSTDNGSVVLAERNCYDQWPQKVVIKQD